MADCLLVLSFVSAAVVERPDNAFKEKVTRAPNSKLSSIMEGNSQQGESEVTGHLSSAVKDSVG